MQPDGDSRSSIVLFRVIDSALSLGHYMKIAPNANKPLRVSDVSIAVLDQLAFHSSDASQRIVAEPRLKGKQAVHVLDTIKVSWDTLRETTS